MGAIERQGAWSSSWCSPSSWVHRARESYDPFDGDEFDPLGSVLMRSIKLRTLVKQVSPFRFGMGPLTAALSSLRDGLRMGDLTKAHALGNAQNRAG
jgi:hypothetical protein